MMWETKDSQLSFPPCHFPDYGVEAFRASLAEYADRERRFGQ
jgi:undecaprenyl pyrophosphate synthase